MENKCSSEVFKCLAHLWLNHYVFNFFLYFRTMSNVMWLRYPIVTKNWSNHKSSESVIIVNYDVIVYWVNQWTSDRIRVNMKEDRIISSKWLRLGTLGLLYFVQGAPYGFQASSLPGVATNSIPSSFFVMYLKFRHLVKDHWSWWKILSSTFFRLFPMIIYMWKALWVDQDALDFHTSKTRQKVCKTTVKKI